VALNAIIRGMIPHLECLRERREPTTPVFPFGV
jgi:hypothetical protein